MERWLFDTLRDPRTPFVALGAVLLIAWALRSIKRAPREAWKRGVLLQDAGRRSRPQRGPGARLTLAGMPVSFLDETKHFKMIGTTGTGKSTAIQELLKGALARGDRAVFADPDGGYRALFHQRRRGDIVLNPFDRESVRWDPFLEIGGPRDVEELAAGLISGTADAGWNEWRSYARTFLAAVLGRCARGSRANCTELWRLLSSAPAAELRALLAGTPAEPFIDAENARMFGSIRSVTVSALTSLGHVQTHRATPFSVREWVRRRSTPGALFIPYRAGEIAALHSLIAAWIRIAIFEAMNGPPDRDQRLWFVIDELDALGAIEGLKDALTRLRKFGGRCVLGFQSIAQVSGTYGASSAQTIVENCGTTLILRCSSSENGGTAHFASRLIGDREVVRRQASRGRDRGGGFAAAGPRRSKSVTEHHVTEAAVMASQIEQLPDLCGYLKAPSSPAWRKVRLARTSNTAGVTE